MPDPVLLKNASVWLGGYDLTGSLNSIELSAAKADLTNGRFGDGLEVFYPGLKQVSLDLGGFFAAGVGEPDPIIWSRLNSTPDPWPLTVAPPYAPGALPAAAGNIAYALVGDQFGYTLGAPHGALLPYKLVTKARSTYDLYRQTIMTAKALYSATETSAGRNLGALLATQQMVVVLDAFAINGGSWVLTVESDENDSWLSATARATLTAVVAAPARQVVKIAGPITDVFWRCVMTKTGGTSLTYAASLGVSII